MRICIFTHTFPRYKSDVAAPFMGVLAKEFVKIGNEVFVLAPFDPSFQKQDVPYHIQTYKYIWPERLHLLGYSRTLKNDKDLGLLAYLLSPLLFLFGFLALLRVVIKNKIEVISAHWIIPNGFIASLVSWILGTPLVITIPGSDIYLAGKNFLFRNLSLYAAKQAKVIISDSQHYLDQLKDLKIYPKEERVIRYGVNTGIFKPQGKDPVLLKKFGLGSSPVVLTVGRLVPKKGFIYLIEALPQVLNKIPEAKLVIVGEGDQKSELLKRVSELKLEKSCIFVGTVSYDELVKYYNLADVFVMPSIRNESGNIDASPVAMMEAMCCGIPVVATRFASSSELINSKNGVLVEEKNSHQIADAIITILKKDLSQMKKAIKKKAEENFSSKLTAKKYKEVFNIAVNS